MAKTMKATSAITRAMAVLMSVLLVSFFLAGCTDWEKTTFKVLSADKDVVDQAVADYNAGKITQTTAHHDAIEKARSAHDFAVRSFAEYEKLNATLKTNNAGPGSDAFTKAEEARQVAVQALADLPALIEALKPLLSKK